MKELSQPKGTIVRYEGAITARGYFSDSIMKLHQYNMDSYQNMCITAQGYFGV